MVFTVTLTEVVVVELLVRDEEICLLSSHCEYLKMMLAYTLTTVNYRDVYKVANI